MISIRQASITELEKIVNLNKKVMANNTKYDKDIIPGWIDSKEAKEFFAETFSAKDACYFVAEDGEKLIGYVSGNCADFPYRKHKYYEIDNLGVIPEYKGQGIGTLLLESIGKWAKKKGYQKFYLQCYAKNEEALAFYKKTGFETIDVGLEKDI